MAPNDCCKDDAYVTNKSIIEEDESVNLNIVPQLQYEINEPKPPKKDVYQQDAIKDHQRYLLNNQLESY